MDLAKPYFSLHQEVLHVNIIPLPKILNKKDPPKSKLTSLILPAKKLTASNTSYPNSPIKIIIWERSTQYTKPIVSRNPAPRNE